jgi:hypothetical protein
MKVLGFAPISQSPQSPRAKVGVIAGMTALIIGVVVNVAWDVSVLVAMWRIAN